MATATKVAAPGREFTKSQEFLEGRRPTQVIGRVLLYAALVIFTLLFMVPFVWLISNSLKDAAHAFDGKWIPEPIFWQNYVDIFHEPEFPALTLLKNSVIVTALGVVSVVFSSSLIAFALARLRFPGSNLIFLVILGTMMMPGEVTLVPVYLIWRKVADLTGGVIGTGTLFPLWVPGLFGSAFYIFMLRQFFQGIPYDLIEAARVDGASYFRIYWQIMLPLTRPALLAVAIFEFEAKWKDFMGPLIYVGGKPELHTLPVGLQIFSQHFGFGQFRWEMIFVAAVLMALPLVVAFLVAQKHFVQGVATSGIKG